MGAKNKTICACASTKRAAPQKWPI
jgi:hypothetical protein